ncbi:hypothetical protein Q4554_15330 [Leptospira santarosai]|uniref:hypothetical protein n=1 Tax=Leptospira santarosai TaxID=28183 RepID=UPI0026E48F13|nr:hypothetical protein [Leptospira santarosai]MDO6395449.1 hypothetical protein [Leptospira santarosai]
MSFDPNFLETQEPSGSLLPYSKEPGGLLLPQNNKPNNREPTGLLLSQNSKPVRTGKRNFCPLLSAIVIREYNSTHALAAKYGISQQFISYVLHGDKRSKRVEQIIFTEWGITVSEFQQITLNWLELREQGRTYTQSEITDFGDRVRARKMGIPVEELRRRKAQILGGIR